MKPIITFDNIRFFAYVNTGLVGESPKGIVVSFFGLGGMAVFAEDPREGKFCGTEYFICSSLFQSLRLDEPCGSGADR